MRRNGFPPFKLKAPGFTSCCVGGPGPGPRLRWGLAHALCPWGRVNEGVEVKGVSPEKLCRAKAVRVLGGVCGHLLELGFESWGSRLQRRPWAAGTAAFPPAHPHPPPGWLLLGESPSCVLPARALGHRRLAFPSAQPGPCVSMYRPHLGDLSCTQIRRLSGRGSVQCCSRDHPHRGLCPPARRPSPCPPPGLSPGSLPPLGPIPFQAGLCDVVRMTSRPTPQRQFRRRPGGQAAQEPKVEVELPL